MPSPCKYNPEKDTRKEILGFGKTGKIFPAFHDHINTWQSKV